jgi:Methylase involved in ubiquinone/menaquinone biosynthesis
MDIQKHNENIREQFSKQAEAYTSIKAHAEALDQLIQMSGVSKQDNVLDVACGSGIVSCEFAKYACHVTGIDITENMLVQARELQVRNNLNNVEWVLADAVPLQFPADQFSIVVSRFSFHHFIDCEKVLDEMIRVCKPEGMVMVVDVALPAEKVVAYNTMERLRDPSHVAALTEDQFDNLFRHPGLSHCRKAGYTMAIELESQLNASFPNPGDREKLRELIVNDAGKNQLGVQVAYIDGKYMLHYPIHIYTGQKIKRTR